MSIYSTQIEGFWSKIFVSPKIFLQFYYSMIEIIVEQKQRDSIPFCIHMIAYKIEQNDVRTAPQGHRFSQSTTLKIVSLRFIR